VAGTVTVVAGGLTNSGTLAVAAGETLTVTAGNFANTGPINIAGTLTVPSGTNSDTINVASSGIFTATAATTFTSPGKIVVEGGGIATDGAFVVGPAGTFRPAAGATFSYGADSYDVVAGDVTLGASLTFDVDDLQLNVNGGLIIGAGFTLTIADASTTGLPGIVGGNGATVEIINTGSITGAGANNFYANNNTIITVPVNTAGTSDWSTDALDNGTTTINDIGWLAR
jgi:hypothetical protein